MILESEKVYVAYIRLVVEYVGVVWDECTIEQQDRLEKVQHEAAKIIAGLLKFVILANW